MAQQDDLDAPRSCIPAGTWPLIRIELRLNSAIRGKGGRLHSAKVQIPASPLEAPLRLAKLTAPTPAHVHPRERLFRRLDGAAGAVWLTGAAGAGKTTLVTSYLGDRGLPPLWYHLDRGDADPAAFFAYLSQAARALNPAADLPPLTAEYLDGLEAYTRNYFRQLFGLLPPGQRLVFDDYHEVPAEAPLHEVLRLALEERPADLGVIVISRADPPPALARLRAEGGLVIIGREELRLTGEEAAAVGRLRLAGAAPELLGQLHDRTQGWVAGLVLMLERFRDRGEIDPALIEDGTPLVFDYLAGEVLGRMSAEQQALLLKTSLLPSMTPSAVRALTGRAEAADFLEDLYRRGYFTVRHARDGGLCAYEYHPLFRQFLLERGRDQLAPELTALKRRAATLLAGEGAMDACVPLLREIEDWALLAELILQRAPALLAEGRYRTLQEWLEALPTPLRQSQPWLSYYLGLCRLPFALGEARDHFERAYLGFRAAGTVDGLYLAWAGAIDTYLYAWDDFKPADWWIAEFDQLQRRHAFPSAEIEARVVTAAFAILMYRQPQHPDLPRWMARLKALLFQPIDPLLRMTAANHLVLYYSWWIGELNAAAELVGRLETGVDEAALSPLTRIARDTSRAVALWMTGDLERARSAAMAGLRTAQASGVHVWDGMLWSQCVWTALTTGDLAEAAVLFKSLQNQSSPGGHLHLAQYYYQRHVEAFLRDDGPAAASFAEAALDSARASGVPWAESVAQVALARGLLLQNQRPAAEALLAEAEAICRVTGSQTVLYGILQTRAEDAARRGEPAEIGAALGRLFALMRRHGFANSSIWHNSRMARLCALALSHDIETDYVCHLIRLRGLSPGPDAQASARWPWPVKIYTLGRFEIMLEAGPLAFGGKTQKRPLELLKVLLAFGGRQVPESRIVELLWPDADGDAGHANFVTTLQRLRKLLGHKDLLPYRDGQLSLEPSLAWVDAWAFESTGDGEARLALYGGGFLAQEPDAAWATPLRERLRGLYVREVCRRAQRLGQQDAWEAVIELLERALRAEQATEEFYQQLMNACAARGQRAEALAVYARCRQVLATHLQIRPSRATEALRERLLSG